MTVISGSVVRWLTTRLQLGQELVREVVRVA